MLDKRLKYSSFTLIEMLIVIAVLVLLMGMAFSAYQNLQTTIRLNEYTNNLEQVIRKVQRDAMLLDKKPGENWIYGLGIDLTSLQNPNTLGEFKVFKWCSPFPDYGDVRTKSAIPNFDPNVALGEDGNGDLPTNYGITEGDCKTFTETTLKTYFPYGERAIGKNINVKPPKGRVLIDSVPLSNASETATNHTVIPSHLVFEAVTGRAFFYGPLGMSWYSNAVPLNFNIRDNNPRPYTDAKDLVITIQPLRGSKGKKITVHHISGRVTVEANDTKKLDFKTKN